MVNKIYDIISLYIDNARLNINYLNESEPSYSIEVIGDKVIRKYLDDMKMREFTFDLWYIAPYGDDIGINAESLDTLNKLAEDIECHEEDEFLFFAADIDVPPHLVSVSPGMAKYKTRICVTYAGKE